MIRALFLAAVVLLVWPASAQAQRAPSPATQEPPTQVEDVLVTGTRLDQAAEDYVAAVSAPPRGREPAAWRSRICVGVGGMATGPARALADRVLDWGHSLGLAVDAPGCTPNIIILATDNGDAAAQALVAARPREFRTGTAGSDRGAVALRAFQTSGRAIRWWHVSLTMNEDTDRPAVRLPGQGSFNGSTSITIPADLGVYGITVRPSRLSSLLRDDLQKVVIVLDMVAFEHASFSQVADHVSMAALAQIDPTASPATPSILHLFDPAAMQEETLSHWDQAYLRALYTSRLSGRSSGVNASELARATVETLKDHP